MPGYLDYTRERAAATPPARNRIVDFWRALAIVMVFLGHWLAASIWLRPDGEIVLINSLEWIPYAGWITWIVQVMPVFFLAGGFANARGLRRLAEGRDNRSGWITGRARRLFTPVIPLLVVWVLLIIALRPFVPSEVVYAGAMSATVPLWFLAVYLSLTALAPTTHAWWRRQGGWTIAVLAGAAAAVDLARFVFEVPGIGWVNFLFVWAAVHQIGYLWADRDAGRGITSLTGWAIAAAMLATLGFFTWADWYPAAMVGIPGFELTNMTPPTFALLILGVMQAGIIWGTQPWVQSLTARPRVWHGVVAFSGVIMTVYLWHLSAMSLVAAAGLFTFDGAAFEVEPGTTLWWVTRPAWVLVLLAVTLGLVALFARFEWRISDAAPPHRTRVLIAGVLLTAGSAAAVANVGITTPDAVINWSIPIAAVLGAALLGALPQLGRRRSDTEAPGG